MRVRALEELRVRQSSRVMECVVAKATAIAEGSSVKFTFEEGGEQREAFVLRYGGRLFAYRNECRHIPMTMDWSDNRFLSRDGCFIQCATHGALYEITTGLCIEGPPLGQCLRALDVKVRDGLVLVTILQSP